MEVEGRVVVVVDCVVVVDVVGCFDVVIRRFVDFDVGRGVARVV